MKPVIIASLLIALILPALAQTPVHPRHAPRTPPHYRVHRDIPSEHEFGPADIIIMPLDAFLRAMPRINSNPDARR
jgi:hypothetical protein